MAVRRFDPTGDDPDRVTEDGVESVEPSLSIELTPIKRAPKVTKTQARAATNMRFNGASYEEIAEVLDYADPATARQVVEAHIAKAYSEEAHASLFQITARRLEELYQLARAQANPMREAYDRFTGEPMGEFERNPEQLAYIKVGADLVSRISKLHGLDAPTRVEVSPDLERFEEVVQRMTAEVRGDDAIEVDVVEYAEIDTFVESGEFDAEG